MESFSVVDDTYDPRVSQSYFLSIQVTRDGFSFCTLDPVKNKYVQMEHVRFSDGQTIEEQSGECFRKIEKLNLPYKKALVLLPTGISTRIPSKFFDPGTCGEYLAFCNNVPANQMVMHNHVKMAGAYNIFPVELKLFELFKRQFPDPIFYHQATPVIESVLSTSLTGNAGYIVFIILDENYFDLLVFGNNNLKLCNNFPVEGNNDLIYFTLFTLWQLKLHPASTRVIVGGYNKAREQLVAMLSKYVQKINFSKLPLQFEYSHKIREINNTAFHNLLSLPLCV